MKITRRSFMKFLGGLGISALVPAALAKPDKATEQTKYMGSMDTATGKDESAYLIHAGGRHDYKIYRIGTLEGEQRERFNALLIKSMKQV